MMRTQIQLDESDYEELRQVAAQQRRSMADCIREGIRWVVRQSREPDHGIAAIAGKFKPRPVGNLKAHDLAFVEAVSGKGNRKR